MRPNSVKRALKSGQPAVGTWLSLGNITAARFLARGGWAWLTVDVEHSGHFIQEEQPVFVTKTILDFLQGPDRPSAN